MADKKETRKLILGWRVTKGMDPEYWLTPGAKPGRQQEKDLEAVAAEDITQHTMIVAQSGSGKSFFLGRFIEEIALQTRCNVLVLDPNSDFRKIYATTDKDYWTKKSGYDSGKRKGYLPEEASRAEFWRRWKPISKKVYTAKGAGARYTTKLTISWYALSIDWLFREAAPPLRTELWHFHEFMRLMTLLLEPSGTKPKRGEMALLQFIKTFCGNLPSNDSERIVEEINSHPAFQATSDDPAEPRISPEGFSIAKRRDTTIERAAIHKSYVTSHTVQYYFGVLHEARESRLFTFRAYRSEPAIHERIRVVDLPSVDEAEHRAMVVSNFLDREWNEARERWREALRRGGEQDARVPMFIIVDEAHNFVFAEPRSPTQMRLQEQFRRIAAEGRKFGLYLILVTQRPDKVDRWVVSEMENRALMKLGSEFVLRKTSKLLGLNARTRETAARCLEFDSGRAMLIGPWAGKEDRFLYAALRRTEEGGRNLREESWTIEK